MPDNLIKFRISADADSRQIKEMESEFGKCTEAARGLIDALKAGAAIDVGGKIVNSIVRIPKILKDAIAEGVRFNAELETTRLTIAGMVKQFSGGAVSDFNAGLAVSDQIIQRMRASANELGLSFESTLETYKTTAGALFNAGVTDLQKQVDLTILLSRAMQGMGISGFMAARDVQDILTGMADRTKAGRELGLHDDDIKAAEHAGKLYEFLTEKLSGFTEAGAAGMHTFTAESQRLDNQLQALKAEISQPVFEALTQSFAVLSAELAKPEVRNSLREVGFEVAEVVKGGAELLTWAVQNSGALVSLAHAAGLLATGLAAIKISEIVIGLGLWIARQRDALTATVENTSALSAETAALAANTAARVANAAVPAAGGGLNQSEAANLADRAHWIQQQRQLRPGGTTYAEYIANGVGGVVTGEAGSAAARGMGAAELAPRLGGVSSLGSMIGRAGMGLAGGIAYGEMIYQAVHLVDGLIQLKQVTDEGRTQARGDDRSITDDIFNRLMQKAATGLPGDRDKMLRNVEVERSRLEGVKSRTSDEGERTLLARQIERLNEILPKFFDNAQGNAAGVAAAAKADANAKAKEEFFAGEEFKARDAAAHRLVEGIESQGAMGAADSPSEKLAALHAEAARLRRNFAGDANEHMGFGAR